MKKILLIALMVIIAVGAFAAEQNFAKSYNKDGQFNIYASVGYLWGFDGCIGLEYVIGEFNIGGVPLDYGIMAKGIIEWWNYGFGSALYWGVAPTFAVHFGLKNAPVEFFASVGVGFNGFSDAYLPFGIGFATFEGAMWHFADKFSLLLEGGYIGYTGIWGVGIEIAL